MSPIPWATRGSCLVLWSLSSVHVPPEGGPTIAVIYPVCLSSGMLLQARALLRWSLMDAQLQVNLCKYSGCWNWDLLAELWYSLGVFRSDHQTSLLAILGYKVPNRSCPVNIGLYLLYLQETGLPLIRRSLRPRWTALAALLEEGRNWKKTYSEYVATTENVGDKERWGGKEVLWGGSRYEVFFGSKKSYSLDMDKIVGDTVDKSLEVITRHPG